MTDGDTSNRDIGRRIEALMEALRKNPASFSLLTGISANALANYRAGSRRPDWAQAIAIVRSTGVTLDWIYMGNRSGLPAHLLEKLGPLPPVEDRPQRKAGRPRKNAAEAQG